MGYRLHVLTKYQAEYGIGSFSWHTTNLQEMAREEFGFDPWEDTDAMELDPGAVKDYVKKLRKLAPNGINQYFKAEDKDSRYTNKEVADYWQEVLDTYDKTNDYIRLEWF